MSQGPPAPRDQALGARGKTGSLARRRVVLTRSEEKAADLREALEALGAEVVIVPSIRHAPPRGIEALARAVAERETFAWVVFTSKTAVPFFLDAVTSLGAPAPVWTQLRLAAVGGATARALREAGLTPALVAGGGAAELARRLVEECAVSPGDRVLLPQSAIARPELREALEAAGVVVDAVPVYETVAEEPARAAPFLDRAFAGGPPNAVVFASPSAVEAFLHLAGERGREALESGATRVVTIGPTTSRAVKHRGLVVYAEASIPSTEGLVRATAEALG